MAESPVFHSNIKKKSRDYLIFKRDFFTDPWTAIRGEYNRAALARLAGAERAEAEALIEENLATGPQFAHAALDLGLTRCIPRLIEIFDSGESQIELGFVLRKMGAISSERVRDVWMGLVDEDEKLLYYMLPYCCKTLDVLHAAEVVRRGVASLEYAVRSLAYMCLFELEDLIAGGGLYTEEMATASNQRWQELFKSDEVAARRWEAVGGPEGEPLRLAPLVMRANGAFERALALGAGVRVLP